MSKPISVRDKEGRRKGLRANKELDYLGNLGRCAYLENLGTAKNFRREETGYKIRLRLAPTMEGWKGREVVEKKSEK